MTGIGVIAGAAGGLALARLVGSYIQDVQLPGVLPVIVSAGVLLVAAVSVAAAGSARGARRRGAGAAGRVI